MGWLDNSSLFTNGTHPFSADRTIVLQLLQTSFSLKWAITTPSMNGNLFCVAHYVAPTFPAYQAVVPLAVLER
jgi:hypothetical protein